MRQAALSWTRKYLAMGAAMGRSRDAAQTVQRAAAGIGALFSAGVGLSFAASESTVPLRATLPLIFLGLSVVFATVYLAWLGGTSPGVELPHEDPEEFDNLQERRESI